jgi:alpha-D-xyloside xylohydrolase
VLSISIDASGLDKEAESEFHISTPDALFGLGEQFSTVNLADFKTDLHPDDKIATPGHKWDYMSIPFVYGPKGNGIYFDTAFNCSFDSTAAGRKGFTMRVGGPIVDLYLIAGQGPKKVLESYTAITGRTPLPPPWAFGVWHNGLQGRDAVLKIAKDLRNAEIPVSAIWVFDLMDQNDCMGWPLWTYGYYGPIGQFTEALHKLGFKVLTYIDPYVRSLLIPYPLQNPDFTEAVRNQYLVTNPDGQPAGPTFEPVLTGNVDFTNPEAVNWWQEKLRRTLVQDDFDGWMEDFGEWIKDDHRFAAGKTGRVMATLNPLIYHKTSYEISHRIKPDVVEFDRSGAPGSQAFTRVLWGGDQTSDWSQDNGLPAVVKAGISAGLSGFAVWGPDILSSGTSKELWIRWTEFGALSPIMRDHLWDKPKFAVDLWFDSETIDVFRQYARLHISLFPYLYTFAHEAARTGLPIMRHPMLEWADDPRTYDSEYEYLLGDAILVAPVVTEGARTRSLYLPKGMWVDYWRGQLLEGERLVTVSAPLHQIPILVRAGSIIPFASPDIETLAADLAGTQYKTLDNGLIWRVFASSALSASKGSFTVYDGTKASTEQDSSRILVKGESSTIRHYEIVVNLEQPPREVLLAGKRLEKLDDSGYHADRTGWWFDPDAKTMNALFLASDFALEVTKH